MPCPANTYLAEHAQLIISSYHRLTGKDLVEPGMSGEEAYRSLFEAPYALVTHNTAEDPIFNYGNQTALRLFEMDWSEFTRLASRKSAEPVNRAEREALLTQVTEDGFIDNYRGVRISSTGKRFWIEGATVWNLTNEKGQYCGQAAVFSNWTDL
ncbi:MEKHLA domain-containing protein [Motiliproteus sp. MSK22-1]|nr:MEKHLA domain-containing protein [Motiliproteus sp. MSK22-1]